MTQTKQQLESMTNKELLAEAKKEGIMTFPDAKNTSRPSKEEIISALLGKDTKEPTIASDGFEELVLEEVPVPVSKVKKELVLPKHVEARIQKDIAMMRVRVIISKNTLATSYSVDQDGMSEDNHKEIEYVEWGNDGMGYHKERIVYDVETHIRRGCLKNLQNAISFTTKKVKNRFITVPVKTFNVSILEPLTESELRELAREQMAIKRLG